VKVRTAAIVRILIRIACSGVTTMLQTVSKRRMANSDRCYCLHNNKTLP
jgi:hypothetical protein